MKSAFSVNVSPIVALFLKSHSFDHVGILDDLNSMNCLHSSQLNLLGISRVTVVSISAVSPWGASNFEVSHNWIGIFSSLSNSYLVRSIVLKSSRNNYIILYRTVSDDRRFGDFSQLN